ncbi:MAG TPA: Uma2 family endonuclease [Verrucomicrobiae bacterium]|nr:Uma2 family endonuclease [Verrucomicrobiae bacterium]
MAAPLARPARPFTYADLEEMPDDGYRREIIGGSLVVSPAPIGRHQRVSGSLFALLRAAETADSMVLSAPYDWRLPDGGSVEPDIVVIQRVDFDPDGPLASSHVPMLVAEVLSPSNQDQDRSVKRHLYESLGVPAYWMVDPQGPSLIALRLRRGRYQPEAEVAGAEALVTDWPFSVRVVPAGLGR